jgi:hypothetical protein
VPSNTDRLYFAEQIPQLAKSQTERQALRVQKRSIREREFVPFGNIAPQSDPVQPHYRQLHAHVIE